DGCILAVSDDAEADANAESYSGSIGIQIGEPEATATSNPFVNAYIGDGTTIITGGNVIVRSESDAHQPDPNKTFGDNITAVTPNGAGGSATATCGFAANSVCYTQHGLITGSEVKYVVDGGVLIGGLVANHLYTVIVVDDNTLRFGDTFSGQSANADSVLVGAMGVDGNRSMVRFAGPHNFETRDAVIYQNTNYTPDRGTWNSATDYANGDFVIDPSDGKLYRAKSAVPHSATQPHADSVHWAVVGISDDFHEGQVLFVRKIDQFTIELYTNKTDAMSGTDVFSAGSIDSTNHLIANSDLADGERVTYKTAAPIVFNGASSDGVNPDSYGLVNADVCLLSNISCVLAGHFGQVISKNDTGAHDIYLMGHAGLSEGEPVIYQASDPSNKIGGLTDGAIYYVHFDTDFTIQLANSYCEAAAAAFASACKNGSPDIAQNFAPITRPAKSADQALRPAPIVNLTDGFTYTVDRSSPADGSHIMLKNGSGDIAISAF